MLTVAALLLQAAAPAPSAEADQLGLRLARAGTLAALAPSMIEKDLADLAREDPSLTEADRQKLLETGRATGRAGLARITAAMGHEYARRLSVADLRQLVAASESEAAQHKRAADPQVLAGAMQAAGPIDFKKDAAAAFCRQTGKLCDRK